jgi:transcriptional regulator with GAF, ATPase, and Fis domain
MESEFFGHEKGAFTGATQKREGRFGLAHRGTIFLDEIGELPGDLQAKLLRVLQEGEYEAVGSSLTRKVDVRVIAATNRSLEQAVRDGNFRADLFYRLNVFPITVPPLRMRGEDIKLLAEAFTARFCRKMGRPLLSLTANGIERLCAYGWPGNVRELQNVIERAVITSRSGRLDLEGLLPHPESNMSVAERGAPAASAALYTAAELRDLERTNLLRALERCEWRVSGSGGAAQLLQMPASTLASRMKALALERPRRTAPPRETKAPAK